jgi:hypothetical protein
VDRSPTAAFARGLVALPVVVSSTQCLDIARPPLHAPDRSRMRSLDADVETSRGYATLSAPAVTASTPARRRRWRALRDRSRLACSTWFRGLSHLHDSNTLRAIRRPPRECRFVLRLARDGSSPSAAASPKARLGRRTRRVSRVRSATRSSERGKPHITFPSVASASAERFVSCGLNSAQWPVEIAGRNRPVSTERSPSLRHDSDI